MSAATTTAATAILSMKDRVCWAPARPGPVARRTSLEEPCESRRMLSFEPETAAPSTPPRSRVPTCPGAPARVGVVYVADEEDGLFTPPRRRVPTCPGAPARPGAASVSYAPSTPPRTRVPTCPGAPARATVVYVADEEDGLFTPPRRAATACPGAPVKRPRSTN